MPPSNAGGLKMLIDVWLTLVVNRKSQEKRLSPAGLDTLRNYQCFCRNVYTSLLVALEQSEKKENKHLPSHILRIFCSNVIYNW
jgi:hypothetical protein